MIIEEILNKDDPWEELGYTKSTNKQNNRTPSIGNRSRINLNVPYAHREAAKKAGARWDAGIRKWYMMVNNEELKKIPSSWR
ncbi:MAG: DUF5710 domain-containing protein [Nitrososphaeraceae archaeon]